MVWLSVSSLVVDANTAHQNWTFFAQEIDDVVPLGMSIHSEQLSGTTSGHAALS
jgi:hypothetical protein